MSTWCTSSHGGSPRFQKNICEIVVLRVGTVRRTVSRPDRAQTVCKQEVLIKNEQ
jgi:hypothetical protein